MTEYVSKDVIIAVLKNEVPLKQFMNRSISKADEAMNDLCVTIRCLPAADVRPVVHGEWEEVKKLLRNGYVCNIGYVCNKCNGYSKVAKPYCYDCGADMREG